MKSPSQHHTNKRWHNWLIYSIADAYLERNAEKFRGILYDLGAGESPYKRWLLQYVDKYVAVDWSASMHVTKPDVVADLNKPLPIEDSAADTVISLSVLEHLCEPQTMLCEAFRILKSGGCLVLQVPWQWSIHEAPHDYFRFTPYGLKYLLEKAGFGDVDIEPQSGFFTMWLLKLNYFTLRLSRGPLPMRVLIRVALLPVWTIGQLCAPMLDRLDRNCAAESSGYFVTAKKP